MRSDIDFPMIPINSLADFVEIQWATLLKGRAGVA